MLFFDDLEPGRIDRFGSYEVTREEVIAFAEKFDPQPFHLSDEAAAKTHFGRLSASGWHTCAMTMRMYVEHIQSIGHQGLGSPGLDELRWPRPVFPGDRLRAEREVLDLRRSRSRPEMGIVSSAMRTLNQAGQVVLSFTVTDLMSVRPA